MDKTISALKVQKKNPERINVYLDGEFAFGLSRIVAAWLTVGQKLSEEKIRQLLSEDTIEKGYQRALTLLQYRTRSEAEICSKLSGSSFDDDVISRVIERLKTNGLLGDMAFAKNWVENRAVFRPRSHKLIKMELRQKGVDDQIIETALQDAPKEEVLALQLARKHLARVQNLDRMSFRKKMNDYLLRRGFPYSVIRDVVEQLWSEVQPEGEISANFDDEENEYDY